MNKSKRTELTRRHGYRSFKDRVDLVRIEPLLNLTKRTLDYVEVLHTLTVLEHWRECNLLALFTEFSDEVAPYVRLLPQLLYHKATVWRLLHAHLLRGDKHALQPLLEIAAQLAHDLGPDFLPFYPEFLATAAETARRAPEIAGLAAKGARAALAARDAAILEWVFNSVAYVFKYLQRHLVQDLVPTLAVLFPLLSSDANARHATLARFAAEALLFLLRKQRGAALAATLAHCFGAGLAPDALTTLFVEAIALVRHLFHLRGMALLDQVLATAPLAVACDVVARLVAHALPETAAPVYAAALAHRTWPVLATLAFADAGRKVGAWPPLVEAFLAMPVGGDDATDAAFVAVCLFRNAPALEMARYAARVFAKAREHHFMFEVAAAGMATPRADDALVAHGVAREVARYLGALPPARWPQLALFKWTMAVHARPVPVEVPAEVQREVARAVALRVRAHAVPEFWQLVLAPVADADALGLVRQLVGMARGEGEEGEARDDRNEDEDEDEHAKDEHAKDNRNGGVASRANRSARVGTGSKRVSNRDNSDDSDDSNSLDSDSDSAQNTAVTLPSLPRALARAAPVANSLALVVELVRDPAVAAAAVAAVAEVPWTLRLVCAVERAVATAGPALAPGARARVVARATAELALVVHETRAAALALLPRAGVDSPLVATMAVVELVPLLLDTARDVEQRLRLLALDVDNGQWLAHEHTMVANWFVGQLLNKFKPSWLAVYEAWPKVGVEWGVLEWYLTEEGREEEEEDEEENGETGEDEKAEIETEKTNKTGKSKSKSTSDSKSTKSDSSKPTPSKSRSLSFTEFDSEPLHAPGTPAGLPSAEADTITDSADTIADSAADTITDSASTTADSASTNLLPTEPRFVLAYNAMADHAHPYHLVDELLALARAGAWELPLVESMRTQVLRGLVQVPLVASDHLDALVALVDAPWPTPQRNLLLEALAKHKLLAQTAGAAHLKAVATQLLGHVHRGTQKLALEVLSAFLDLGILRKYQDLMRGLLDDQLFRDQMAQMAFAAGDEAKAMPYVLRVLFGRVQGRVAKLATLRNAVLQFLPKLSDENLERFLAIAAEATGHDGGSEVAGEVAVDVETVDVRQLKRLRAYTLLLFDVYKLVLVPGLAVLVPPLVAVVQTAEAVCEAEGEEVEEEEDEGDDDDEVMEGEEDVVMEGEEEEEDVEAMEVDESEKSTKSKSEKSKSEKSKSKADTEDNTTENNAIDTTHTTHTPSRLLHSAQLTRASALKAFARLLTTIDHDWTDAANAVAAAVAPLWPGFARDNATTPTPLFALVEAAVDAPLPLARTLLYPGGFAPVHAMLALLTSARTSPAVAAAAMRWCQRVLTAPAPDDRWYEVVAHVVTALVAHLPAVIRRMDDPDVAVRLLLTIIDQGLMADAEGAAELVVALTHTVDRHPHEEVLRTVALLLAQPVPAEVHRQVYTSVARVLGTVDDSRTRAAAVEVMLLLPFALAQVTVELNAVVRGNLPDFERRLKAYRDVQEHPHMDAFAWLPIVHLALFFVNDDELPIHRNAQATMEAFIAEAPKRDDTAALFERVVVPALRRGLRSTNDIYIELVAAIVRVSVEGASTKAGTETGDSESATSASTSDTSGVSGAASVYAPFRDMAVLDGDDDTGFFQNITHVQPAQRLVAIFALRDAPLTDHLAFFYLVPLLERWILEEDDRYAQLLVDAAAVLPAVMARVHFAHWCQAVRRYAARVRRAEHTAASEGEDALVVPLRRAVWLLEGTLAAIGALVDMPDPATYDRYLTRDYLPLVMPLLLKRNDHTLNVRLALGLGVALMVDRLLLPLVVAVEMPRVLLPMCNVLRSRLTELRDGVRKTLVKLVNRLGGQYLVYIFRQLKAALVRGSHLHVLAYTVHYLLTQVLLLEPGELDDLVALVSDVVMEDIFGALGLDKDAEGYTSKMKEVHAKKLFETAQVVAQNVLLPLVAALVDPLRKLLLQHCDANTLKKLDHVALLVVTGLAKNARAASVDMLQLCFELFAMATPEVAGDTPGSRANPRLANQTHFLVDLNRHRTSSEVDMGPYVAYFQRFALELLRTLLKKHPELKTSSNLAGFVPVLLGCLRARDEGVIVEAMRVLEQIILDLLGGDDDRLFDECAATAVAIIDEASSTAEPLAQGAIRFLTAVLDHRDLLELDPKAVGRIVVKCQADVLEHLAAGLVSFRFIRAVVERHFLLPEVYDVVDSTVAKIMVTNHNRHLRDAAREIYHTFLMEYDQLRGRLEKQFKFLVANLGYPTEEGRELVMELVFLVIDDDNTPDELVAKVLALFFVALCQVAAADLGAHCRQMAHKVLERLLGRNIPTGKLEQFVFLWMSQDTNPLLKRCGLTTYKTWLLAKGETPRLDKEALRNVQAICSDVEDAEWELVYTALNTVAAWLAQWKDRVFGFVGPEFWTVSLVECLAFPHPWVRLVLTRLMGVYLGHRMADADPAWLQQVAYKLLSLLGHEALSEELGTQLVKNLVQIAMHWQKHNLAYVADEELDQQFGLAMEFLMHRATGILRKHPQKELLFTLKKAVMKLVAMLIQIVPAEQLEKPAEAVIIALNTYIETDDTELRPLALEVQLVLELKLGMSEFSRIHAHTYQQIHQRRVDRRAKRAQLAIDAPDVAAANRVKKHIKDRKRRKVNDKDENGLFRVKKKRRV